MDGVGAAQRSTRLAAAFAAEVERGLTLAARVRLVVLVVITAWVMIENPFPEYLYFLPYLVLFALFGFLPLWVRRDGRPIAWVRYLCPLLDMGLFTLLVMIPNPLEPNVLPAQLRLRFGNEIYLFAFIVASDAAVAAARREGAVDLESVLAGLKPGPAQTLRGRSEPVAVWVA